MVAQIESDYERARVLTDLASGLAAAGEFDRAEIIARSIPNERERVQAMIALAQMADQTRARRLVAWALRNGTWSEPLTALARIQPDAVLGAADRRIQRPSRSAASDVLESARLVGSGVVEPKRIIGGDAGA